MIMQESLTLLYTIGAASYLNTAPVYFYKLSSLKGDSWTPIIESWGLMNQSTPFTWNVNQEFLALVLATSLLVMEFRNSRVWLCVSSVPMSSILSFSNLQSYTSQHPPPPPNFLNSLLSHCTSSKVWLKCDKFLLSRLSHGCEAVQRHPHVSQVNLAHPSISGLVCFNGYIEFNTRDSVPAALWRGPWRSRDYTIFLVNPKAVIVLFPFLFCHGGERVQVL